jgi:hypothetical protein
VCKLNIEKTMAKPEKYVSIHRWRKEKMAQARSIADAANAC